MKAGTDNGESGGNAKVRVLGGATNVVTDAIDVYIVPPGQPEWSANIEGANV